MKTRISQNPKARTSTAARLTLLSFTLITVVSGAFFVRSGDAQNPVEGVVWMSMIDTSAGRGLYQKDRRV